jgi:SAM-dependent methyltransferase
MKHPAPRPSVPSATEPAAPTPRLLGARRAGASGVLPRLASTIRRWLGPVEVVTPDGVRYRPRRSTADPLGASPTEYDVEFPAVPHASPASMRIRPTAQRVYADLAPSPRLGVLEFLRPPITPGQRVLDLGCGSGEAARVLARLVGPTGGVVAIDADRESIRYARRRDALTNTSFEIGGHELLAGELDGAFDAALITVWPPEQRPEPDAVREAFRVIRPGGRLLVGVALERARDDRDAVARALRVNPSEVVALEVPVGPPRAGLLIVKPGPEDRPIS